VAHKVVFAPEAQADLLELYDTIARDAGEERALAYVERIAASCLGLATFPSAAHYGTTSGQGCA